MTNKSDIVLMFDNQSPSVRGMTLHCSHYLFIHGLFNDTYSMLHYTASNDAMIGGDKFGWKLKKAFVKGESKQNYSL
jgi:hypothetical protein